MKNIWQYMAQTWNLSEKIYPQLKAAPVYDENNNRPRKQLEDLRTQCMAAVDKLTKERNYIWHKDEFQLLVRTCSQQELLLNDESTTPRSTTKETPSKLSKNQEGQGTQSICMKHGNVHFCAHTFV